MAIRYVDKGPEDLQAAGAKPKARSASAHDQPPREPARPAPEPAKPEPVLSSNVVVDGVLPGLAHAKPDPKPRGRKKAFG